MERPAGVTVLAALNFIGAAAYLLIAVGAFMGGSVFLAASAGVGGQFGWGVFALIGAVCLILAGLTLAVGLGMWKLLNWSRVLQIVLLILFLALQFLLVIGALMHFSLGRMIFRAVVMGIEAWILGYLFKTHVKRAFGAASP